MDDEIAEIVRQHGWFAAWIYDHSPPFLYTVGLVQSLNHPELIVFGMDGDEAHDLISALVAEIRGGRSFANPGTFTLCARGADQHVGCRRVHPSQHPLYLGYAMAQWRRLEREGDLDAVQIFWENKSGRFPFDVGCDIEVFRSQPRLDLALTPSELKRLWQ